MKYRLEAQPKSSNLHWIFYLETRRNQTDPLPVVFGKDCVVVGIQCWTLFKENKSNTVNKTSGERDDCEEKELSKEKRGGIKRLTGEGAQFK